MKDIKIIAFANHKGGVGKTTTVASLAPFFARKGYRVLMIDLDPQCSLTESFLGFTPETSIYDAFLSPKSGSTDIIIKSEEFRNPVKNLDLIPSSPEVSELENVLSAKASRERILEKILRNINVGRNYDIVMMDCAPDLYLITQNALVACNELFVPTTAEILPMKGLKKLESKCEELAEDLNPDLQISGIIINRYNKTRNLNESVDTALRKRFGNIVFKTKIRENIRLAESPITGKNILDYAPGSNGAIDFNALGEEILKRFQEE